MLPAEIYLKSMNIAVFFCSRSPLERLSPTQLFALMFLNDVVWFRHEPITMSGLHYRSGLFCPVPVFDGNVFLLAMNSRPFLHLSRRGSALAIYAKKQFDDSEFADDELRFLRETADHFVHLPAGKLLSFIDNFWGCLIPECGQDLDPSLFETVIPEREMASRRKIREDMRKGREAWIRLSVRSRKALP